MNLEHTSKMMFVGPMIHSLSIRNLEYISRGILVVAGGKIVHLQKDCRESDVTTTQNNYNVDKENVYVLKKGEFLIPGFVDTHIHASQYPNAGLGYDLVLLDWLLKYTFPLEKKFVDENYAERVYNAVVKKTLANGTTTASYFATIHKKSSCILADCIKKQGQRAFVGKVNMNNKVTDYCEDYETSVADTREFIKYVLNLKCSLIKPVITPRFALSCDMKLLKELGKIAAEYDLPIQTHISENREEIREVKAKYPNAKNYLSVYDEAGLITRKTILAHGIHLEAEELETIKNKGATISHCASSNILLQSGICPVYQYLNDGIKVSLGTDCSGGHSCSMLDCIRQTLMLSVQACFNRKGRKLSIAEVFYLATLGGAEGMCLQDVTGNFTLQKDFDAILVDMNNTAAVDILDEYTLEELFQKFIYLGNEQLIKKVYVAGRLVKQL